MGRKNKIKLIKHGSGSPSQFASASMGDAGYFGSVISNERQNLDPEVMRANLTELVDGPEESRAQKLLFVQSEFDKKSAELAVARKIIKQFQKEFHSLGTSSGEGDANTSLNQELMAKTRENEECTNQLKKLRDALEPIGEKFDEIFGQKNKNEDQLQICQEKIRQLEDLVASLERDRQKSSTALEARFTESMEFERHSKSLIRDLETSLQEANNSIYSLREKTHSLAEKNTDVLLQLEKDRDIRRKLEVDLADHKQKVQSLDESLKKAQLDASKLRDELTKSQEKCEIHRADLEIEKMMRVEQKKEFDVMARERDDAIGKIGAAESARNETAAKMVSLEAQIESLKISCNDVTELLMNSELTREQLKRELEQLHTEDDELYDKLEDALKEVAESRREYEKSQKEVELFKNTCNELEGLLKELDLARLSLEVHLADKEKTRSNLESLLKEKDGALLKVEQEFKETTKERIQLIEKLEAVTKEANVLHKNEVVWKAQNEALRLDCADVAKTFEEEQRRRMQLEQELNDCIAEKKKATDMVEFLESQIHALKNMADVSEELQAAIEGKRQLKATYEARFESINSGVQQIKRDFAIYQVDHSNVVKQNEELQYKLVAVKADAKYYKEERESCRTYIKKLEEQIADYEKANASEKQIALENELKSIKTELHDEYIGEKAVTVLDAVKTLKSHCESSKQQCIVSYNELAESRTVNTELVKKTDSLQLAFDKLTKENQDLLEEKKKLTDEVAASKNLIKKVRKERDNTVKKMKRRSEDIQAANATPAAKAKDSEEALSEVTNSSGSNDSLQSDKSEASSKNFEKEEAKKCTVDHSETAALQLTLAEFAKELVEKTETISTQEKLINELQVSTTTFQQKYEDELLLVRRKLEATEDALCVQQDMNAKMEEASEQTKKANSEKFEELFNERDRLIETNKKLSQKIDQIRDDRIALVRKMESEIEEAELGKRQALDELISCQHAFTTSNDKVEALEKELARIQELERTKTKVLVNLTEEEKKEESDAFKIQIGKLQKEMKEQKDEAKKHLDNEIRKVKKSLKISDKNRMDAEAKMQEAQDAYQKLWAETGEVRTLFEAVHADDQAKLEEMEKALKAEVTVSHDLRLKLETLSHVSVDEEKKMKIIEKLSDEKVALETAQGKFIDQIKSLSQQLKEAKDSASASDGLIVREMKEDLQRAVSELETVKAAFAELSQRSDITTVDEWKKRLAAKEKEISLLTIRVDMLEKQMVEMIDEFAQERAGLVNELCVATEKNKESDSEQVKNLEEQLKLVTGENERNLAMYEQLAGRQADRIDVMLPNWDPALRQFLRLLQNRNISYGVIGVLAYIVLIHLYILCN